MIEQDSIRGEILIVDDQPNNLRVLYSMLSDQHYDVRPVTSGKMALDSVELSLPDIILLDINMPEMNGYEVCQSLKANEKTRDIPILFISVLDEVMDKVKAFQVGGVDYITKPFQVEEVLARVDAHLTIQHTKQALQHSEAALRRTNEDLVRLNAAYERFVPYDIVNLLGRDHIVDTRLSDYVEQPMTIMFAYIRTFSELSQKMSGQETFTFINSYLSRACPVIRHHNGFISSYIGDNIMALFPNTPDDALKAALTMFEEVFQYNILRQAEGNEPISIGIGLHTACLMLGIIGEPQRLQTTIVSETLNMAARMERLSRYYGVSIVMSEATYNQLSNPSHYAVRCLAKIWNETEQQEQNALELLNDLYDETFAIKKQTTSLFEDGVVHYQHKQFTEAKQKFQAVLNQNASDQAAKVYYEQAESCEIAAHSGEEPELVENKGMIEQLTEKPK